MFHKATVKARLTFVRILKYFNKLKTRLPVVSRVIARHVNKCARMRGPLHVMRGPFQRLDLGDPLLGRI